MISNEAVNPTLDFRCEFQYWIEKLCWFVVKPKDPYQVPIKFILEILSQCRIIENQCWYFRVVIRTNMYIQCWVFEIHVVNAF